MTDTNTDDLAYVKDLPGYDRGNPMYFDNEVIDHLISIVLDLGAELWVVKDRLAYVEEVLSENGGLSIETLEAGRPSAPLQEKLNAERLQLVKRIYGRLYSKYDGDKVDRKSAL